MLVSEFRFERGTDDARERRRRRDVYQVKVDVEIVVSGDAAGSESDPAAPTLGLRAPFEGEIEIVWYAAVNPDDALLFIEYERQALVARTVPDLSPTRA